MSLACRPRSSATLGPVVRCKRDVAALFHRCPHCRDLKQFSYTTTHAKAQTPLSLSGRSKLGPQYEPVIPVVIMIVRPDATYR